MKTKHQNISILKTFVSVLVLGTSPITGLAVAAEKGTSPIERTLVKRAQSFCDAVLPKWFASQSGMGDAAVKGAILDCYMAHARLVTIGVRLKPSVADASLPEVPSLVLKGKAGISLDIYRPLAGQTLTFKQADSTK